MANELLSPKNWEYFTELVRQVEFDAQFLTKLLIGSINARNNKKVVMSPIREIEYDFVKRPLAAAPMRGFFDEPVKITDLTYRERRVVPIYSIPMEDEVDLMEATQFVPPPATDTQASVRKLNDNIKAKIVDKQTEMKKMIARRIEIMLGQIIVDGKISYDDGQFSITHDFELDSNCFKTVDTLWTEAGSDPIMDLRAMRKEYSKLNYAGPEIIIFGENAVDAFLNNDKVRELLDYRRINFGSIEPRFRDSSQVELVGQVPAIGEIYTYYGVYDDNGTKVNFLDPDYVYMINSEFFRLYYGAIYSTLVGGIKQLDFFSYVEEKTNHRGYRVYVESKPMPAVIYPTAIMAWKVV